MSLILQIIGLSVKGNQGMENRTFVITNNETVEITDELLRSTVDVVAIFYGSNGSSITSGTTKPMLYQDGDGTWEPFTGGKPAPNPDYPMPIENVRISKLVSYGKNIISGIPSGIVYYRCEYEYNNVTKELTIKATGNDAYIGEVSPKGSTYKSTSGTLYLVPKNATKVYFRSEKGVFNNVYATFYDENKKSFGYTWGFSYSVPKGAKYVSFRIGVNPSTSGTSYTDKVYASFDEISGDYVDGNYEEVETSLTLAQDDIYQNGTITRARKQVTFDGSSDEAWAQNNCEIGYRYSIALTPIAIISDATNGQTSFNTSLPLGDSGATYGNKNCYTIATDNNLWVSLNGTETLEEFRQYLQGHPMTLEYTLATPTTEELKIPTVPSYFPYTEVSTDNTLETDMTWKVLADCDNSLAQEALEKRIEALEMNALGE
jgi:hypothetical protein